ncbi:folate-binding protein [Methylophilaceae bacterium]|nr:folate-binding protein [Methylophilaceae bacterium]
MANPELKITNLDVIVIKGKDAETFLQGQITNDIKLIKDEEKAIYAGYCSPKGRLIAFFLIIKVWDNYFLFCPTSISDEISKKLSMYILRSKVELEKTPDNTSYFIFYGGTNSEEVFKNIWGNVPYPTKIMETTQHPNEQNTTGLLSITKLPDEKGRFLVVGESKTIKMIYDEIFPNLDGTDSNSWNASDIEAKIPNVFKETQEKFIPQSLNLDLINAINFKKGCYTGQEIVARTHYLGKPKRRMYLGSIITDKPPKLADEIFVETSKVGQIINFYKKGKNYYRILFEILIETLDLDLMLHNNKIKIKEIS